MFVIDRIWYRLFVKMVGTGSLLVGDKSWTTALWVSLFVWRVATGWTMTLLQCSRRAQMFSAGLITILFLDNRSVHIRIFAIRKEFVVILHAGCKTRARLRKLFPEQNRDINGLCTTQYNRVWNFQRSHLRSRFVQLFLTSWTCAVTVLDRCTVSGRSTPTIIGLHYFIVTRCYSENWPRFGNTLSARSDDCDRIYSKRDIRIARQSPLQLFAKVLSFSGGCLPCESILGFIVTKQIIYQFAGKLVPVKTSQKDCRIPIDLQTGFTLNQLRRVGTGCPYPIPSRSIIV